MKIKAHSIMALAALAGAASLPQPALAQGTTGPTPSNGKGCPGGYAAGSTWGKAKDRGESDPGMCYPNDKKNAPAVFQRKSSNNPCPAGMRAESSYGYWCTTKAAPEQYTVEGKFGTAARLTKPSKGVRCPTGWSSTEQLTECFTTEATAPTARLSGGKPCALGEFNDWGVWCTSNYKATTARQAYRALVLDFNRLYTGGFQNMEPVLSLDATAHFGPDPDTVSSSSSSASSSDSSKPAEKTAQCATDSGSANGAAIGGAVGGEAGAALGGMLGGLSKKKKKAGC
jgi:hypothetical protein